MQTGEAEGGAQSTNSGAEGTSQNQDTTQTDTKPRVVTYEDHERALTDLHRFKRAAKELEDKKLEMERKLSEIETKQLQEKEDYKTLAEKRLEQVNELTGKYEGLKSSIYTNHQMSAVKEEALKAGLRPEAVEDLELLDVEGVAVEMTNTGKVTVVGAKDFVDGLKNSRKHWFKPQIPNVNSGSGSFTPATGSVTAQDVGKLEREAQRKKTPESKAAYLGALAEFKKQKLGKTN